MRETGDHLRSVAEEPRGVNHRHNPIHAIVPQGTDDEGTRHVLILSIDVRKRRKQSCSSGHIYKVCPFAHWVSRCSDRRASDWGFQPNRGSLCSRTRCVDPGDSIHSGGFGPNSTVSGFYFLPVGPETRGPLFLSWISGRFCHRSFIS